MTELNDTELEVLRILWEEHPLKPAEIQSRFPSPIENATLRSLLVSMVERNHLERRKQGKAFFYSPVARKPGMLRRFSRRLSDVFAGGSPATLIAELIRTENLSEEELEQLRSIAAGKLKGHKGGDRK
jgi:predicted transcriptional regulator